VCRLHGGAPQVVKAAKLQLALAADAVAERLVKIALAKGTKDSDVIAAAKDLLESATALKKPTVQALTGIRVTQRGQQPIKPEDPFQLRATAALLMDCALRPDECFRLRWEHVRDGAIHVLFGKTENARRTIPLTSRAAAFLEMRQAIAKAPWVFAAPTPVTVTLQPRAVTFTRRLTPSSQP
jgi:integrase